MGKRGQPSKGDRDFFGVRPTKTVGQRVREEAAMRGMYAGNLAAEILAAHYGLPATNPPANDSQEELPLQSTA